MYVQRTFTPTHNEKEILLSVFKKQNCVLEKKDKEMEVEPKFKRICVFCGSSAGNKTSYRDAAIELGAELVKVLFLFLVLFLFSYL